MRPLAHHRGEPWPSSSFSSSLPAATTRLSRYVTLHMDSEGAVRDPCLGRPLETALLLRLLQDTGRPFTLQDNYFRSMPPGSDPFDVAIAQAALGWNGQATDELHASIAARSPGFTGPRKRALLDGVFAVLSASTGTGESCQDSLRRDGLHSWAQVQVTALKGILTESLAEEDVDLLVSTQLQPEIWEGNVLIHLCTLHALRRLPGTEAVVAEGIRKVLPHMRLDGSVPFVTDTDTWCTVTAGIALDSVGAPEPALRRIARRLVNCQQPNGGWSYTDAALQTDVDDTSVALQFLQSRIGYLNGHAVERGLSSLLTLQHPQGGFPTYIRDSVPEACMTVAALDAFTSDYPRHHRVIADGLSFLADEQLPDGTFPPDWSSSLLHTVFRTVLMTSRIPAEPLTPARRIGERALRFVLQSQNDDGGWGQRADSPSDPISTSYALMALCAQEDPRPAAAGVRYLLGHQQEDGSIASVSDSIGPRPFIFHVPLLADIFALMALGHVARRIGGVGDGLGRTPHPGNRNVLLTAARSQR
ncbi:squalene-hopene/tetraprenyl-beta-curcumene cyclase/sporulenol synthase [Kibdelosporangium banguiense]|uniref:Squalene-hopene/tetraprenyl-beta-curcumene cyclase/sporulenol synthase n=1 Tax=Kibdelosporangium banguiense TaxID=1365924 RepID=A0ABS4TWD4_9PSEU|nr:prenyltransferase/squalene oxidase repeat-containing protein [Kibdelosporangium banguiense]MBP2328298.1 squalene-hopene/tetraprenyl-beta-curcumene cyclase/sporulenol synthase [Kibdelosporangium banguiense]